MNTLKIELPKRFENAVSKLYNAFHENRLDAFNCKSCAVGNICDNNNSWSDIWFTSRRGLDYYQNIKQYNPNVLNSNYNSIELAKLELVFLNNFKSNLDSDGKNKESQFKGLCAVVEYLCELDNIPNIMEYKSLFETENNTPKRELSEVFI